ESAFLFVKNPTTARPPLSYTELQTAHKLQSETAKTLKSYCRKEQKLSKKRARPVKPNRAGKFKKSAYQMHKKVPRVWANNNEKISVDISSLDWHCFYFMQQR
ncbi:MAG: hypothetical protein LBS07_01640, partial [Prevotellaceae bacterium]|nr:hypothetical protein [Prevotellaceae bacterium]